jgi:8-oxo-dGTP diphosphatase
MGYTISWLPLFTKVFLMTLPMITVSGALLQDDEGRILLAQRPANKPMPFLWEIPGGKLEIGESPENALVRELQEELGIIVDPQSLNPFTFLTHCYPDFRLIILVYQCSRWHGSPQALEGQGGIEWVMPHNLHHYPMSEANWPLIPLLQGEKRDRF